MAATRSLSSDSSTRTSARGDGAWNSQEVPSTEGLDKPYSMRSATPLQMVATSIRREGIPLTVRKVISALREPWFDLLHGTDTTGRVRPEAMDVSGPTVEHALGYEPSSHHEVKALFRRLELPEGGAFVDFGCGKGRVLLLATEYRYERIVGVEFSAQLCEVARTNVLRYCSPQEGRVEVLNEDATRYAFQDDETVLFFFNPFREVVMNCVLENVYESLRRRNRRILIVYHNPECRSLIETGGIFLKIDEHRLPRMRAFVYTNVGSDPMAMRRQEAARDRPDAERT